MASDDLGDSETAPESETPPAETAESPKIEVPPEPKPKRSLEGWFKARENILKGAAVIISVCAVLATGASATAAWFSWQTANRSADAAEQSADTAQRALDTANQARDISEEMKDIAAAQYERANALLEVARKVYVEGSCENPELPPTASFRVYNWGLAKAEVSGVQISVLSYYPGGQRMDLDGIAVSKEKYEIEANQSLSIEMDLDCDVLDELGLGGDYAQKLNSLASNNRVGDVVIHFDSIPGDGGEVQIESFFCRIYDGEYHVYRKQCGP